MRRQAVGPLGFRSYCGAGCAVGSCAPDSSRISCRRSPQVVSQPLWARKELPKVGGVPLTHEVVGWNPVVSSSVFDSLLVKYLKPVDRCQWVKSNGQQCEANARAT